MGVYKGMLTSARHHYQSSGNVLNEPRSPLRRVVYVSSDNRATMRRIWLTAHSLLARSSNGRRYSSVCLFFVWYWGHALLRLCKEKWYVHESTFLNWLPYRATPLQVPQSVQVPMKFSWYCFYDYDQKLILQTTYIQHELTKENKYCSIMTSK